VESFSASSWDTNVIGAGAAVSAHAFAIQVSSYYATRLGWSGQDGRGAPFVTSVHYSTGLANAFWDTQTGGGVFFGDGDQQFLPASVDNDVVCHEITHGVTHFASGLGFEGESGALNESISDIFAAFFKHSLGVSDQLVWIFAPRWDRLHDRVRDMAQPASAGAPDHMSRFIDPASDPDDGGLHANAGISNNAAFLMTMGGTNPTSAMKVAFGIGYEKSEKLWWRALTAYVRETTTYAQLAASMQQAATDNGLTQNEKNIVDCAWKAVGVVAGTCGEITNPTPPATQPTTTPQSKSTSAGDDDDDSSAKTKKKKASLADAPPAASTGCTAGARAPHDRGLALLLRLGVVGAAIAIRRRRRGRPSAPI
jgi:thermolysin